MSLGKRSSANTARVGRRAFIGRSNLALILLLVLGGALYLHQAFQYYWYDDEGSFAYAAWRVSLGEVPYERFFTSQMPAFLYWGGLLVRVFGRSFVALRLASMLATLLAACLLYAANRQVHGSPVALLAMGLFLIEANVFHSARFFLSEAYMVLFDVAGICLFVLGQRRGRIEYVCLAGVCFGLSVLNKLFGILPLGGCLAYLAYAWWRERSPSKRVALQSLALVLPAALVVGLVVAILWRTAPGFYSAVYRYHTAPDAGSTVWPQIRKAGNLYWDFVKAQPLAVLLAGLGACWLLRQSQALPSLLVWQIPTVLAFAVMPRSLFQRHLTYLAPTMATLVAVALGRLLRGRWQMRALALVLAMGAVIPWVVTDAELAARRESDSARLAALIQGLTASDERVLTDFSGLNFLAGRPTTYWGAEIAEYSCESGRTRGAMLIDEIEEQKVPLVIINTLGGADHMVNMVDYPEFRRYVQSRFALVERFECTYRSRELEIYARDDTMPVRPELTFQGQIAMTGVRFSYSRPPRCPMPDVRMPTAAPTELRLSRPEGRGSPSVNIEARWQCLGKTLADYQVSLRLVDATGAAWAQVDEPLVQRFSHVRWEGGLPWEIVDTYPTSAWEPGQVVLMKHVLEVRGGTPSGAYYLIARLYDANSGCGLATGQGKGRKIPAGDVVLATLYVVSVPQSVHVGELPVGMQPRSLLVDGVELLGTDTRLRPVGATRDLPLRLFWRASDRPEHTYRLEFRLLQDARVVQRWPAELVAGFPTSQWQEGDVLLGHYVLPLGSKVAEGDYLLEAGLVDQGGSAAAGAVTLASDLRIEAGQADSRFQSGAIGYPLQGVSFAERIGLTGYDLPVRELRPGDSMGLTLHWACLQALDRDYKVFVHLLDGTSQIQGQCDAMPDNWRAPTSRWAPGDALADHYEILLPATVPVGTLQVEIGFYDPETGERLVVLQDGRPTGEDRLLLPTRITVY